MALLVGGVHAAARAIEGPEPLLACLGAVVSPLATAAGELVDGPHPGRWLLGGLALSLLVALTPLLRRFSSWRAAPIVGACGIAWLGQAFLIAHRWLPGVACLGVALGLCAWRWRPGPTPDDAPLRPWSEVLAWLALTAVFCFASLYRIDVWPEPSFDEDAYFKAARMQIGELDQNDVMRFSPEAVIYHFSRFQAQALPNGAQSAALLLWGSRITSTRLASLLLSGAALLLFAAQVRARWGPRTALLTLAFAVASPLVLAHARRGLYIAASELHAVVCFVLLLRLERLRSAGAAGLLGAALGASIYLYQLSYFVPVLCGLCLLITPSLWPRRHAGPLAALAGSALLVAVPAAWISRDGLGEIYAQSVDKLAPSLRPSGPEPNATRAILRSRGLGVDAVRAALERGREHALFAEASLFGRDSAVLLLSGAPAEVERVVTALATEGWDGTQSRRRDSFLQRVRGMLSQLLAGPAPEEMWRWVTGPVLNPLVAPLLLLGGALAWRRREDVMARFLLLWLCGALLLPALVAGPLPRRAVLAVPIGFALAARLVLEATSPAGATRRIARAAVLGRWAFAALVPVAGIGLYFGTWVHAVPLDAEPVPSRMEIEDVVRSLPADETVLATRLVSNRVEVNRYLRWLGIPGRGLELVPGSPTAWRIRRASCQHEPPFTWLTRDTPEQRVSFDALAVDQVQTRFTQRDLLAVRVTGRTPTGCQLAGSSRP